MSYFSHIDVDSSALPTGAATEAKQDDIIAKLPLNEVGRLKTSNLPADITPVTGNITANAQTIPVATDRVSNVMAHCYGTFSTVNCTFEGSINSTNGTDGNWFTIQAVRTSANTVETTTGNLSAAPAYGWELSVNALRYMRVRATAFTSGNQSWVFSLGSYATEPIPAIQSHAVTLAAAATAIAKAEDSASASANVGVPPMVVRADTLQANAGVSANGDYAFVFCDVDGRVYTTSKITESALPTGAATADKQLPDNHNVAINGYRSSDGTWQPLRLDMATNTIQTIDYAHHEIHAGSHFMYTDSVELDSAATQDYLITTPDTTKWAHMLFDMDGSAITQFQLYESADRNGTTLQTTGNNNRNSLTAATVTVHKGQSGGTTDGSLIHTYKSGSASAQSKGPSSVRNDAEIILKQNTKYILRITSGTNDNLTNVRLEWYEHTDIV